MGAAEGDAEMIDSITGRHAKVKKEQCEEALGLTIGKGNSISRFCFSDNDLLVSPSQ